MRGWAAMEMASSSCEVVSFLGVPPPRRDSETGRQVDGRYESSVYAWRDQECATHLFPLALQSFFNPRRIHLLVTDAARHHGHFTELQQALGGILNPVAIPDGRNERELWEIFVRVTEAIPRGIRVIFDITHGFRSLPFLAFLTVAYLRRAREVSVQHILYGNFEARDRMSTPPRVPVFDLTPFVDLLDWLTAVEALRRRDDADPLASLLRDAHERPWRGGAGKPDGKGMPRYLDDAAAALRDLSMAMHLARPMDLMGAAQRLGEVLPLVRGEVARWAPPFALLLQEVEREYVPYADDTPKRLDAAHLRRQHALIRRFVDKGLAAEACLLGREWLVNLILYSLAPEAWLDRGRRREVETALASPRAERRDAEPGLPLEAVPQIMAIREAWDFLHDLRNDVAHCGFRDAPRSLSAIMRRVQDVPERLARLLHDTMREGEAG